MICRSWLERTSSRILEAHTSTVLALTRALEDAGIEFIDENGGGPGSVSASAGGPSNQMKTFKLMTSMDRMTWRIWLGVIGGLVFICCCHRRFYLIG